MFNSSAISLYFLHSIKLSFITCEQRSGRFSIVGKVLTHVIVLNFFMFQIVQCPVTGEAKQVGEYGAGEINGGPVIPQTEEHVVYNVFRSIQIVY